MFQTIIRRPSSLLLLLLILTMAEDVNIIVTRSMIKRKRSLSESKDDPVATKKLVVTQKDSTSGSNISTRWFENLWDNV